MSKIPVADKPGILFAEECDRGTQREENQDSVLHAHIALGDLMIVADGMGGHAGGATASRMAVESFFSYLSAFPSGYPAESAIRGAAQQANANIRDSARAPNSKQNHMGSTVVVALVQRDAAGIHAWVGHIGDSRAYLLRAGRLHRLTTDHTVVQALLKRNLITPEEALHHPDALVLSRSLGHKPEVEIDIEQHPLAVDDTLLLCSDGLWGYVSEQDIQYTVDNPDFKLEAAARELLKLALAAGGHDNVGIEMARLTPPLEESHHEGFRPNWKLILVVFLLAIAVVGVLAYFALWNN